MEEEVSKNVTERVMNGVPTMKPLPYQLRLYFQGKPLCGATLLSPNIALTAFHCIADHLFGFVVGMIPIEDLVVYAGAYEFEIDENQESIQKRGVRKPFPIDNKDGFRVNDVPDLAVLLLDEPFEMNEFVTPACLPTREVPIGEECIVSGWGHTNTVPNPSDPETLRAATVSITKLDNCERSPPYIINPLGEYDICAYHPTKDACNGDSGGPLVCKTNGGATLYGVVSRGPKCNSSSLEGKYGVYGNVYYFKDEIEAFIRKEDPCPTNEYDYGDGLCDGFLNNSENCFDGGDCCGPDANYVWCDTGCYPGMECVCQCRA